MKKDFILKKITKAKEKNIAIAAILKSVEKITNNESSIAGLACFSDLLLCESQSLYEQIIKLDREIYDYSIDQDNTFTVSKIIEKMKF